MICAGSESGISSFNYRKNKCIELKRTWEMFFFIGTVAPCQFDEGSPLVQETNVEGNAELIAIGIMSKNQGCSNAMIPTIYTRLSAYSSWFIQTAGPQVTHSGFA